MGEEVVQRPIPRIPATNVSGQGLDTVGEVAGGARVVEPNPEIVKPPEGEDAPVEHEGGRVGRVLLEERAATEQRPRAAGGARHAQRPEPPQGCLGEALLASLPVKAHEQAGDLPLGHRRDPGRAQRKGVGHRNQVHPGAVVRPAPLLLSHQVLADVERGGKPLLALAHEVALEAPQGELRAEDMEPVLVRRQRRGRPARLLGLEAEVHVVAAQLARADPGAYRGRERAAAAEEVGFARALAVERRVLLGLPALKASTTD
jgi:hypothetical protein